MARRDRPRLGAGLLTLLFLFVSCNAAFVGGAAVSKQLDTTNRLIAFAIFVPLAASVVVFAFGLRRAFFGRWLSDRRWKGIDRRLIERGFRSATPSEIEHTNRLPAHILAPAILGPQRGGGIDHVRIGEVDGREVRCFNVRVRGGAWADVPVVAVHIEGSFPPTVVWNMRFPVPPRPGMRRMRFELDAFNRTFSVYSTDRFFASAMIDARMIEWLLDSRRPTIEFADRWVIAWHLGRLSRSSDPSSLLEVLQDLDRHIPRVVPSLFHREGEDILWSGERSQLRLPSGP
jgi:hypothetical protein